MGRRGLEDISMEIGLERKKLKECRKHLLTLLEEFAQNENNNSTATIADDTLYMTSKDWVSVKEKARRYEMRLEDIARTLNLLKSVRRWRGRVLKNDIKEIIKSLEESGHIRIETVKEIHADNSGTKKGMAKPAEQTNNNHPQISNDEKSEVQKEVVNIFKTLKIQSRKDETQKHEMKPPLKNEELKKGVIDLDSAGDKTKAERSTRGRGTPQPGGPNPQKERNASTPIPAKRKNVVKDEKTTKQDVNKMQTKDNKLKQESNTKTASKSREPDKEKITIASTKKGSVKEVINKEKNGKQDRAKLTKESVLKNKQNNQETAKMEKFLDNLHVENKQDRAKLTKESTLKSKQKNQETAKMEKILKSEGKSQRSSSRSEEKITANGQDRAKLTKESTLKNKKNNQETAKMEKILKSESKSQRSSSRSGEKIVTSGENINAPAVGTKVNKEVIKKTSDNKGSKGSLKASKQEKVATVTNTKKGTDNMQMEKKNDVVEVVKQGSEKTKDKRKLNSREASKAEEKRAVSDATSKDLKYQHPRVKSLKEEEIIHPKEAGQQEKVKKTEKLSSDKIAVNKTTSGKNQDIPKDNSKKQVLSEDKNNNRNWIETENTKTEGRKPKETSEVRTVAKKLPDTKSENNIDVDQPKDKRNENKVSQSHDTNIDKANPSRPRQNRSKGSKEREQTKIRSSYLMKQVTSAGEKSGLKSVSPDAAGSNITVRKSSTEEILSHSVSETDQIRRQKEQRESTTSARKTSSTERKEAPEERVPLSSNPSTALGELFKVVCEEANVKENQIGTDVRYAEEERTLTGFTPDEERIHVAKLLKNNRKLVMVLADRIIKNEGLLDEEGNVDEDVVEGVTNAIEGLDDDDFAQDVKDMMLDVGTTLMREYPDFVDKLAEKILQEIFEHMNVSAESWLRAGEGRLNRKMVILVVIAFNKFRTTGGPRNVAKFATKNYPVPVYKLTKRYGQKYKPIIQRLAKRMKPFEADETRSRSGSSSRTMSRSRSGSSSRTMSKTTLTGTTAVLEDWSQEDMAQF